MALTKEKTAAYTNILKEELIPAMGCTEPIAIAYAASIISHALGAYPNEIKIGLSGNIIKNVKSVIVPKTGGMHGISSAVCAGIISASPHKKLEVLSEISPEDVSKIRDFQNSASIEIYEIDSSSSFEIYIEGFLGGKSASAHLLKRHTNLVEAYLNGEDVTLRYQSPDDIVEKEATDRSSLNVEEILEFAESVDLDELSPISLMTEGVILGAVLKECDGAKGKYRVSLRSRENVDAARICERLGGGGHKRAAGATIVAKSAKEAPE